MYYDSPAEVLSIAKKSGFSIFVDKNSQDFADLFTKNLPPAQITRVEPGKNHKITKDQISEVISHSSNRQTKAYYVIITGADQMNENAQNAFLKLLEEPPENYHFILQVKNASLLLPTVLSRGDLYILRENSPISAPVEADEKIKSYAKMLISAKKTDLVSLSKKITTDPAYKKDARGFAISITECAIEILYKSYFKTRSLAYLKKLPNFLNLLESLKQNGHIKLHLVADLC